MSYQQKYLKKKPNSVLIDANFRIKIEKDIENFVYNSNSMIFEFPASLTNVERAFVHNLAPKYNLKTKSNGFDENRRLSLFKLTENDEFTNRSVKIESDPDTLNLLREFKKQCPFVDNSSNNIQRTVQQQSRTPFVLSRAPTVPPASNADSRILDKRRTLPIFSIRDRILQAINTHRIVLIQGSTGSGKTTQIPQYILEEANQRNQPCRILCTQPRRISAIASCERVCYERSESNSTVGYQIRLESRISQETNCIFLTPGVFLRYLISGETKSLFNNITHILIDEAHERAKENDFLLTSIKEHFDTNPNLKLIIMSATMDTGIFANYFGACEEISISTKQFDVQEIYLEDILKVVDFKNRRVEELNEMYRTGKLVTATESAYVKETDGEDGDSYVDEQTATLLNEILNDLATFNNSERDFEQCFVQFAYHVQSENVPVDFRHSATKMTALMIAVGRGCLPAVDTLLKLKADPSLKVSWNGTEIDCFDIAVQLQGSDSDMKKLLDNYVTNKSAKVLSSVEVYNKNLLNIYYDTVLKTKSNHFIVEEEIDHELIAQLVQKIHDGAETGQAILVFLPGYDDIIQQSNLLSSRLPNNVSLFLLHSSMKTEDQKNVFKPTMQGVRKIILSTNIAESSITIDDVVFVIDSGREKQKSYDAISHSSSLRVQWISKASANQRKGRAGRLRNGVVYRIYSSDRYNSMLETTLPELLRNSLTEICLQTKLMVKDTMKIEEFLQKCIATPSIASIRQSIKLLQCLGALDQNEGLTLIGTHLAQMPVDAKYAKMMIYAIALKCLNPVLSLVSILSFGDQIFVLPFKPSDRFKSQQVKRNIGEVAMSDHFMMLKFFQLWMNLRLNNIDDRKFCEENFISRTSMEHVKGIKKQIMSYLQSSGLLKAPQNVLNENANNWSVVKACLCAGLYPNVARVDRKKKTMYSDIDDKLLFHMSSILSKKGERSLDFVKKLPADWVVFEEKNRVGRIPMIRCNTLVNSVTLSLSAGAGLKSEKNSDESDELEIKIDNLVTLSIVGESGSLIMDLRESLDNMIMRMLGLRNFKFEKNDDILISTIAKVLLVEETKSGFMKVDPETNEEGQTANRGFQQWRQQSDENQPSNRSFQQWRQQPNEQPAKPRPRFQNNQPQRKQDQTSFFPNNNAGPSWRSGGDKPARASQRSRELQTSDGYQTQSFNRQKFFIMKTNSEEIVNDWASRILFDIGQLGLKPFMLKKLNSMNSTQVTFFFYSASRSELLGYGDIMPAKNRYQPLQFHFKLLRRIPIAQLTQNFNLRSFEAILNPSTQADELPHEIGRALLIKLRPESFK